MNLSCHATRDAATKMTVTPAQAGVQFIKKLPSPFFTRLKKGDTQETTPLAFRVPTEVGVPSPGT
jgi:hypothetical protein